MFFAKSFEIDTNKLKQLKVQSTRILNESKKSINEQLNRLITITPSDSPLLNIQVTQFLCSQIENKNQKIEMLHQILMSSIHMTVEWMNRYSQLQDEISKIQQQKQQQQRKTRQSLNVSAFIIKQTMNQKQNLQRQIKEIEESKEYYRQLYKQQIQFRNQTESFLQLSSKLIKSQIIEMKQQTDLDDNQKEFDKKIYQLEVENKMLKNQICQLKSTITQCTTTKSLLQECEQQNDYLRLIPTQSSIIIQQKNTLASQMLQLGKKYSDLRDTNCFSCLSQQFNEEIIEDQYKKQQNDKDNYSQQNIQNSGTSIQQDNFKNNDSSLVMKFVKAFLKRFVHDRIKTH